MILSCEAGEESVRANPLSPLWGEGRRSREGGYVS